MEKQFVGVGYILNIEQFDRRVGLWIVILVHVLQGVLDTNLFAVSDGPYAVELQTFDDCRLEDEHSGGS